MGNALKIILTFAFLFSVSFVKADISSYKVAYERWEKDIEVDGYKVYWEKFIQFNNNFRLDEVGNGQCYKISKKEIQLILIVSKDGRIEEVIPNIENDKSKCFINIYRYKLAPAPPFSPLNIKLTMS